MAFPFVRSSLFGAFFIWGGWGRSQGRTRRTKPQSRWSAREPPTRRRAIRSRRPYGPTVPVQSAALGAHHPAPSRSRRRDSPGDELLESARRAPVLVSNRPPRDPRPRRARPSRSGRGLCGLPAPPALRQPERRNELADKLSAHPDRRRAGRPACRTFTFVVTQGTAIPCVLETADVLGCGRASCLA